MKNWLKYTLIGLTIGIWTVGTGILVYLSVQKRSAVNCNSLEIAFLDEYDFVNSDDIKNVIDSKYGVYIGEKLDSIDLVRIERVLESQSAVSDAQAWLTEDGTMHLTIKQREPVARIMNGRDGYYIDRNGYVFPLFDRYTAAVPVITGRHPMDEDWHRNTALMLEYLDNDDWISRIDSIGCRANGEIILRLGSGKELFRIGKPQDVRKSMPKLDTYLTRIKKGKTEYTEVDLRYNKQIVCK